MWKVFWKWPGKQCVATLLWLGSKTQRLLFLSRQMFQVVHSEKPLYVQAGNCVEASEWLEVLGQVSRCNEGRLATFHPSNYTSGAWQCCKSQSNNAPGCKPCTTWVFTTNGTRNMRSINVAFCVADNNKHLIKLLTAVLTPCHSW